MLDWFERFHQRYHARFLILSHFYAAEIKSILLGATARQYIYTYIQTQSSSILWICEIPACKLT